MQYNRILKSTIYKRGVSVSSPHDYFRPKFQAVKVIQGDVPNKTLYSLDIVRSDRCSSKNDLSARRIYKGYVKARSYYA